MSFSVPSMVDEVVVYCVRQWRMLVRHGAIPFAVIALSTLLAPRYLAAGAPLDSKAIGVALVIAQLLVCVPMVVTWYRMIVLGPEEAARQPIFIFGRREWRLLVWQIVVLFAGLAIFVVGAALLVGVYYASGQGVVGAVLCLGLGLAGLLLALAVINRISFVFALAATDQPVSLRASWEMTRGLTWPLLWTIGIIALGQSIVLFIADLIGGIAAAAIHGAATVFTFAAMATMFGFVFVRIRDGRLSPPAASPAPGDLA